jgi:long-chain acyl-CoA synthetase
VGRGSGTGPQAGSRLPRARGAPIAYLLEDARPSVLVTERAFVENLRAAGAFDIVPNVVVVDDEAGLAGVEGLGADGFDFDAAWRAVTPADTLTLIYTSGTTGPPKGVQLTHANMQAEARALVDAAPYPEHPTLVSYLPMAHIAERGLVHYLGMTLGSSVTCCPDPRLLGEHLVTHPADGVRRRAAGVGEAQDRARAGVRRSTPA